MQAKTHWNSEARRREEERLAVVSPDVKEATRPAFTRLRWIRGFDHTTKSYFYETAVPDTKLTISTFTLPKVAEVYANPPKLLAEITPCRRFCDSYLIQQAMTGEKAKLSVAQAVYKTLSKEEKAPYIEHARVVKRSNALEFRKFAVAVYKALAEQPEDE